MSSMTQPAVTPQQMNQAPRGWFRRFSSDKLGWQIARRAIFVPVAVFLAVTAVFALVNLVNANPGSEIAGPTASRAEVARIDASLGLDRSVGSRYTSYIGNLVQGKLGTSYTTKTSVAGEIGQRLGGTLELVIAATIIGVVFGLLIGGVSGYWKGTRAASGLQWLVTVIQGMPDFLIGSLLIYFLFYRLRWLPAPDGQLSLAQINPPKVTGAVVVDGIIAGQWSVVGSALEHLLMPAVTLGAVISAPLARIFRESFAKALASPQVDFARSLGLRKRQVLLYAWRTSRTSVLTYGTLLFAALLSGDAITEVVFSWNGLGQWAVNSVLALDLPSIEGFVVIIATATVLVYFLLDMLLLILDPTLRRAVEA